MIHSIKRVWLLAVVIMLVSVFALSCAPADEPADSEDPGEDVEDVADEEPETEVESAADLYYDPPIEIETVRWSTSTIHFPEGESCEDNRWLRAMKDEFGIEVDVRWCVDQGEYDTRIDLMLASGDLPDFFRVKPLQFKQLLDADQIQDLTDVYDRYASDAVQRVYDEDQRPIDAVTIDGRMMALPHTNLQREAAHVLYLRTDWLEKLDLPEPETMDDLLTIIEAFATQDPNETGEDDTFGILVDKDLAQLEGFFNGFHAYRGIWLERDGELVYSSIQPEMKEALGVLRELFAAGYIDPEFGTKDFPKAAEALVNDRIGVLYGGFPRPLWPLQPNVNQNPEADWASYPMPSIDQNPALATMPLPVDGYWVVRKGYEHPEAVLAMMDFWAEVFYFNTDQETYHHFVDGPNAGESGIWQQAPAVTYRTWKNLENHERVPHPDEWPDDEITPEQRHVRERIEAWQDGDREMWAWDKIYGLESSMAISATYKEEYRYQDDQYLGAPTETMRRRGGTLEDMEIEVFTNIIIGDAPLDEFDNFVERWHNLGGAEIKAEVNEWYDNR